MEKKIIEKLEELKTLLIALKNKHHSKGEKDFEKYRDLIKRIIDRIYPEKDAKELKERLIHRSWIITGNETDEYWQEFYLIKIDLTIRVINTILEESSLFDFGSFKPKKIKDWDIKDYVQNGGTIIIVIGLAFASLNNLFGNAPYIKGILDTLFLIVIFIIFAFSLYKYVQHRKMDKKGVFDWRIIGWAAAIIFGLWILCKLNIFCLL